ncbi:MAG: hypothetical protein HWN81_22390 [Candidatus Lokiarchaeota archaeon]|nr:hypothetical protein [Candidatus Lokiarchaeota archaeon]
MVLQKNKEIFLFFLLIGVILGIIAVVFLYAFNWSIIITSYQTHEGALGVILIIGIRIFIVSLMAIYTFYSWFKQEKQYFSDMPFLFGSFFLLLIFGKALDLFIDFSYLQLDEELLLPVIKVRYFIAIFDLLPMIFLSIYMILISLSVKERFNNLSNEKYLNKIRIQILIIIVVVEILIGIFVLNVQIAPIIYPIIIVPSLISIIWLFYFSWRNQRLSQVNTFILMIGFGLYLLSQISRPLVQILIGDSPSYVITAESIDIIISVFIFIGFYKKSKYFSTK